MRLACVGEQSDILLAPLPITLVIGSISVVSGNTGGFGIVVIVGNNYFALNCDTKTVILYDM